jgi:hypothetical protein
MHTATILALLQKGGLRRDFPSGLQVQATLTISAVPSAFKRSNWVSPAAGFVDTGLS